MKQIPLTQGQFALVDDEDYEKVIQFGSWFAFKGKDKNTFYAQKSVYRERKTYLMHRFILQIADPKIIIDHRDKNGLNNCKNNLRMATGTQNNANATSAKNSTSQYLGVYWYKTRRKWKSEITKNRKNKCLGYFYNEVDAALAYNKAAKEIHGEFASLNII